MNKDLIPKGHYCYHYDSTIENNTSGYICNCPYNNYKTINGVDVDWCDYINQGDLGNSMSEEDFEKLVEHFGSEDEVYNNIRLSLLWDGCKECGENYGDDETTDEEVVEWIHKVKAYKLQIEREQKLNRIVDED